MTAVSSSPDRERQRMLAETLRGLHHDSLPLLLANAWDVASALVFARAGASVIATTSAGIAATLGYPDGELIDPQEMLAAVARIVAAVELPVTADVEAGYGDTPERAADTGRAVLAAGAVGLNIEDTTKSSPGPLLDTERQVRKLEAIREVAEQTGVPLVVNARTDVFLAEVGEPGDRVEHALARARAYRDAGADCIFIPGVRDSETIAQLVTQIDAPLNILVGPGSPSVDELHALGVARISLGSGPMRATLGLTEKLAHSLFEQGTYDELDIAISYPDLLALLAGLQ